MSKFVELTGANDTKIFINMDLIESFGKITERSYSKYSDYIGMTYLVPAGADDDTPPYIVKESVSDVFARSMKKR